MSYMFVESGSGVIIGKVLHEHVPGDVARVGAKIDKFTVDIFAGRVE